MRTTINHKHLSFKIKELLLISRPRFWMYVLGTFLVGMIASGNPFFYDTHTTLLLVVFSIFFSLPANLLIYGVNDIYDYETDILNTKKASYEKILNPLKHRNLWIIIGACMLPFIPFFFLVNTSTLYILIIFLFTGIFYSATPIRAKSKPPLDILFSSIIYISPGLIGYLITGNTQVEWLAVIGGLVWASAMQTYSAVPDIEADETSGVTTLATALGENKALWFCLLAYACAGVIGFFYVGTVAIIFGIVYVAIVLLSLANSSKVFKYYTYFPLINIAAGAALFFYLFLNAIL
ncbi:prenyltransferase [Kordia jejudonensis]|uniref:prenyltransferase n=1 Tax=Kordia jejudonensis TaxID=1348245 RepID=UPI000AA0E0C2|nr:prenyltransferase [Kordia jejudonensis]